MARPALFLSARKDDAAIGKNCPSVTRTALQPVTASTYGASVYQRCKLEYPMRSATILAFVALSAFAACAKKEAPVEPMPAPTLRSSQLQTGKYK